MSLNCNEINKILDELNLEGCFIQEITQPNYETIAFRTIKQGELSNIIICTQSQSCRINRTISKITKNEKPLRFNEFLKSRVQGMRINSAQQIGLERIIKLDVSTWKETLYIYIKLWSGAGNVIVTDENNIILDCMFRRPKKGETKDEIYNPEPKQLSPEELEEINRRFCVRQMEVLPENSFHSKNADSRYAFNNYIDYLYSEHASSLSREALLNQAEKWYNVKHSKMVNALEKLLEKQKSFQNADNLRHTGDLILTYGNQINGAILDCIDYDTDKEVHIRVDPKLSVQENAALYYNQYKKAVNGLEALNHDIEMSRKTIEALEKEYNEMLNEKNVIKLEQILRHDTQPKQKIEKSHAGLHYEINGWTILVGRTATENDDLLRHTVKGQDMWLHTRDYAGGYVFVKARSGKTVPLDILLYAGNLAVYHSKARQNGKADLYYTQVKYLRRAKNGPKGLVLPTNEKNLFVTLDEEKLKVLDEAEKSAQEL